jgi:hypothetical protein
MTGKKPVNLFLILIILIILPVSLISSQDTNQDTNDEIFISEFIQNRPVGLDSMPIDWFELSFHQFSEIEVYEVSLFPLVPVGELGNRKVTDNIDPFLQVGIESISEQLINASEGFLNIRKYKFENEEELETFTYWLYLNLQYCHNLFFDGTILYDIDYDSRGDLDNLAEILGLDGIERSKLTLTEYPLPFEFITEKKMPVDSVNDVFLDGYVVDRYKVQEYMYNGNMVLVKYYRIDGFGINDLRRIVRLNPYLELILAKEVLVYIDGDYGGLKINLPVKITVRTENIDS